MKFLKIFSSMLIATAMCCFISSCSDDDDDPVKKEEPAPEDENPDTGSGAIKVSVSTISFDTEGGSSVISVTADSEWTVAGPEWLTIDPDSADGDADVTVTAESNYSDDGSEARTGTLTFTLTSGEGSASVTVSQAGTEVAVKYKEVVYFEDDFQWLVAYGEAVNQPDCVAVGNSITDENGNKFSAKYISAATVDGVTAAADLTERGYSFYLNSGEEDTYVVIMPGYIYMYATAASQIGEMYLPKLETVPEEGTPVYIAFSWCPGCSTKVVLNEIALNVIVRNGEEETLFDVWESDAKDEALCWTSGSIELKDVTIDEDTQIILRPTETYWTFTGGSNHCWFVSGEGFKIYGLVPDED